MAGSTQLVHHRSDFGEWEAVHRAPHARLAPYVRRISGWWERTAFSRRREVPHAGAVMIVNIGNRLGVSEPGSPDRLNSYHAFFAGMHTSFVVTESRGGVGGGMQIDLTPIGAYLITGVPAHEVADRVLHLEDVLGMDGRLLVDRLEATPDWEMRFEIVEEAILARMAKAPGASEGVAWAWTRLEAEQGLLAISELCEALSWTPRQLIEGFRRELGLPPKQMARILRFNRAVQMLTPEAAPCLAGIAAECGYYDQAHFSREFRQFAGSTPTQYFERLIPESGGVLDAEPGAGATENSYKTADVAAG